MLNRTEMLDKECGLSDTSELTDGAEANNDGDNGKKPKKKLRIPTFGVIVISVFLVGFVLAENYDRIFGSDTSAIVALLSQRGEEPEEYGEWLKWAIEREIGIDSTVTGLRVRKVKFLDEGKKHPVVHIKAEESENRETIRNRMFADTAAVFQLVFDDGRASIATLYMMRKGKTFFGFTKWQDVLMITLSGETARRFDLQEYRNTKLIDIADYIYEVSGWE